MRLAPIAADRVAVGRTSRGTFMTEADLRQIEARLGFPLPAAFQSTVLSYPFPADSFADEFMLPSQAGEVVNMNVDGVPTAGIDRPLFVGSDGGEERYFVDAGRTASPVYVYELETGRHRVLVDSWGKYLDHIRDTLAEIAADEDREKQRKLTKRWWEFWK
jgi:hypothetical protein